MPPKKPIPKKPFALAVQGSRTIYTAEAASVLQSEIDKLKPAVIITSAKIDGACRLARELAAKARIPLKIHWVDPKYAGGKYERRSKAVQSECDFCLFLWDGRSKGTGHEIDFARQSNIPHKVIRLEPCDSDCSLFDAVDLELIGEPANTVDM
jgi:hypothetical protein